MREFSKMNKKQLIDHFIQKFEATDKETWCRNAFFQVRGNIQHCALGHCGNRSGHGNTKEAVALIGLFCGEDGMVYDVNDNIEGHPKDNILEALYQMKKELKTC